MKQQLIVQIGPHAIEKFTKEVNELMANGWTIVPETLRLDSHRRIACDNDIDICGCVLIKSEDTNSMNTLMALLAQIQKKLADLENKPDNSRTCQEPPNLNDDFAAPL